MTNKKPSASTPASGPDSTWTTTPTTLRPNRRYITTHDPQTGKSIYAASPPQIYARTPALGGMARSFATDRIPVDFTDEGDVKRYRGGTESAASYRQRHIVVPDGGVNLVVVDLLPGAESGMHRTKSVDFSICVLGEIVHELDSGETRVLLPGVKFFFSLLFLSSV